MCISYFFISLSVTVFWGSKPQSYDYSALSLLCHFATLVSTYAKGTTWLLHLSLVSTITVQNSLYINNFIFDFTF